MEVDVAIRWRWILKSRTHGRTIYCHHLLAMSSKNVKGLSEIQIPPRLVFTFPIKRVPRCSFSSWNNFNCFTAWQYNSYIMFNLGRMTTERITLLTQFMATSVLLRSSHTPLIVNTFSTAVTLFCHHHAVLLCMFAFVGCGRIILKTR